MSPAERVQFAVTNIHAVAARGGWGVPTPWAKELAAAYEELQAQNEALREQIQDQAAKIRRLGEVSTNWRMAYHDSAQLASALLKIPAHDTVAEQWRNAYVQVADAYRALLAKTPETYLVDGHDAAYWAEECRSAQEKVEVLKAHAAQEQTAADRFRAAWAKLHAQNEDLSTKYLELREQVSWAAALETANRNLCARNAGLLKALLDDRAKYSRLKRAATDAAGDLNEILDANG